MNFLENNINIKNNRHLIKDDDYFLFVGTINILTYLEKHGIIQAVGNTLALF